MKVILQQDVKNLGKKGDVVEVSEGYGRNFLLPRKAAVLANAENLNVAKAQAGSKARKKKISIKGDITGVGEYEAVIKVHPEITSKIKINIVAG